MRLIDADALLERCKSNYLTKDDYLFEIRNAPTAYSNNLPVMAVIEQIALDTGLLKNSARGLAWDFPDDDKLLKFGLGFHQAMLANAPTVQREGWVSVEDRSPDCDEFIGANFRGNAWIAFCWKFKVHNNNGDFYKYTGREIVHKNNITHWQPLPAAPTYKE